MVTALGTLVFIHKRQRLRRYQALREYYFEQMELSLDFLYSFFSDGRFRGLTASRIFGSFRQSIAALHNAAAEGRRRMKEQ